MQFNNHPPVNFNNAKLLATARNDGGVYNGIGVDEYEVFQGKRIHLVHYYSSGCEYNGRTDSLSEHLGVFESVQALGEWLLNNKTEDHYIAWWVNDLLAALKIPEEVV